MQRTDEKWLRLPQPKKGFLDGMMRKCEENIRVMVANASPRCRRSDFGGMYFPQHSKSPGTSIARDKVPANTGGGFDLTLIRTRKHDVLVDQDVELVTGTNLERWLNIEVLVDAALGHASECFAEVAAGRIRRRIFCRER